MSEVVGAEHRVLTALGDATRRQIFELLATSGPQAVVAIAEQLPVSRPAVSQHLKVLAQAGLVHVEVRGTRRIYGVDAAGLTALRTWVGGHWDAVLDHFEAATSVAAAAGRRSVMHSNVTVPPVVKRRVVALDPAAAFELFTAGLGAWWPLESHSVWQEAAAGVRFEGRVGGRVVEIGPGGSECNWADVLAWDPPERFVLSWHPSPEPVAASTLEVRFRVVEAGKTEVTLEHRGWEEFGADGAALRENYDSGWDIVLTGLDTAVGGPD